MSEFTIDYYKNYVLSCLNIGDKVLAPKDLYNSCFHVKEYTERKIIGFYRHYVLTEDAIGRKESYQYYDMYKIFRGEYDNGEVSRN